MTKQSDIHDFLSKEFQFSDLQIARIHYVIIAFASEISKILILFFLFLVLGMEADFFASIAVLLSIRNFTGGIHLQHYLSCLFFTFTFLLTAIVLGQHCFLPVWFQVLSLSICMGAIYIIGPVSSDNRPAPAPQKCLIFKVTACFITALYLILILCVKNLPFKNLVYWVTFLQIMQLTAAKITKERRQKHEKNN